jgi:hypothetical protein
MRQIKSHVMNPALPAEENWLAGWADMEPQVGRLSVNVTAEYSPKDAMGEHEPCLIFCADESGGAGSLLLAQPDFTALPLGPAPIQRTTPHVDARIVHDERRCRPIHKFGYRLEGHRLFD